MCRGLRTLAQWYEIIDAANEALKAAELAREKEEKEFITVKAKRDFFSIQVLLDVTFARKRVKIHTNFGDYEGEIAGIYPQDAKDNRGNFQVIFYKDGKRHEEVIDSLSLISFI